MSHSFIPNTPEWTDKFEDWQVVIIRDGIEATNDTVVSIPLGERGWQYFIVDDNDAVPVGLATTVDLGDIRGQKVCEVGLRLWETPMSLHVILDDWMEANLARYDLVMARVLARNKRVKRLLQRAGFRLADTQSGLELYVVDNNTYLGRRRLRERRLKLASESSVSDSENQQLEVVNG